MGKKQFYANLQPSEMAIFGAAANIYAAYVSSGQVNDANESEMIKKSIQTSIKLADIVEKAVQSDGEIAG